MNLLAVVALVLFIIGAVLAFLVPAVGHNVEMGVLFAGLACWVASSLFPNSRVG